MMVMRENIDGNKWLLAATLWEKHLRRSFLELVLVSWWSLNCVSVVVGVLVALWWCVRSVLTMFGDVLGVLLMFWLCFCGVLAVFRWCLGGAARMVFFE
jgi:hypothetical protein